MFAPEKKVKTFLDSLAYYLLLGHMSGIETNYKGVMHAKTEIPVSSCPSEIENIFYASGSSAELYAEEENSAFRNMLDRLDERAEQHEIKKSAKRTKSLFSKKLKKNIHGTWYLVDTDGKFWVGNNKYVIADQEVQYQPVKTEYGDYYAMDKILYADGKFYDMNYDEVTVYQIGGILPWNKVRMVGTET